MDLQCLVEHDAVGKTQANFGEQQRQQVAQRVRRRSEGFYILPHNDGSAETLSTSPHPMGGKVRCQPTTSRAFSSVLAQGELFGCWPVQDQQAHWM